MDNCESFSNLSDLSTSQSNLSILSGLTGCESKYPCEDSKPDILSYEIRIRNLSSELQNCLKQNEKHKNDIYNLEHKAELLQHQKFERLARENAQIHAQLENANNYIRKLLNSNSKSDKNFDKHELQHKVLVLEKAHFENTSKATLLQSEAAHWKEQYESLKVEFDQKACDEKELKSEFETKVCCIAELKKKIAQQHMEHQCLLQVHIKLNNDITALKNTLQHSAKSETWYKEQLYTCQTEKADLTQEMTLIQSSLVNKDLKMQAMDLEVERWKKNCENVEYISFKEKEQLLRKVDEINTEIIRMSSTQEVVKQEIKIVNHDVTIEELSNEVAAMKNNLLNLHEMLTAANKKHSELLTQNTLLHKSLTDKLLQADNLEKLKNAADSKLHNVQERLRQSEADALELTKEKRNLEITLDIANTEKSDVEETVSNIRKMFNKFLSAHKSLTEELSLKKKEIMKLQSEKQQLFMSSNWHICEKEEARKKDADACKRNQSLTEENAKLICELYNLKSANSSLKREILQEKRKGRDCIENNLNLECLEKKCNNFVANIPKDEYPQLRVCKAADKENNELLNIDNMLNVIINGLSYIEDRAVTNCPLKVYCAENSISYHNTLQKVDNAMERAKKCMQELESDKKLQQLKICKLKKHVVTRIKKLELKVPEIEANMKKSHEMLNTVIRSNIGVEDLPEELQNLQALLKVKELEQHEREKRYNINNRTLLKKVKEHLRARNAAEKHNAALKKLYEDIGEELNSVKFESSNREFEVQHLEKEVAKIEGTNSKLRESVVNLENKLLNETQQCEGCSERLDLHSEIAALNEHVSLKQDKVEFYENELDCKNGIIDALKNKLQENHYLLLKYEEDINNLKATKETVQQQLTDKDCIINNTNSNCEKIQEINDSLRYKLLQKETEHSNCEDQISKSNQSLQELAEKNEILSKDIELLNASISQKSKELTSTKSQIEEINSRMLEKDNDNQQHVCKLKHENSTLSQDLNVQRSKQYMLQQLNNDLKIALQTIVNQNKILNGKIQSTMREEGFYSMPSDLFDLPVPNKLDETYITQLLENCNQKPRPLGDLQTCLNSLKNEMAALQQQITEKTFVSSSS